MCSCAFSFFGAKYVALYSCFHIGGMKYEFPFEFVAGAKGIINGIPNDLTLQSIEIYTNMPIEIPKNPAMYPSKINIDL